MLKGKRVLVVVPARGGSKGVKLKNLHPLLGVPLVGHVGAVVRELPWVDRAVVSTDHREIADAARKSGLDVPFMRPPALSGDLIGDQPVLAHALGETEGVDGGRFDVVVMLQPTSPLRRPAHVAAVVEKLIDEGWDAVWTVSRTDLKYHPLKQLTLDADGRMDYFDPRGATIIARQQLVPTHTRNGAAYAFTRDCVLVQQTIKGRRTAGIVLDEPMVSIDTLDDFARVEAVLRRRGGAREGVP
jgi:CMP-N,N'-diacetyllegionaminic acid synthase